jgi:hypothetical protein
LAESYFPTGWFANKNIEDENQYMEDASMNTDYRPERILWLGRQLAKGGWLKYDHIEHQFSVLGPKETVGTVTTAELDSVESPATLVGDDIALRTSTTEGDDSEAIQQIRIQLRDIVSDSVNGKCLEFIALGNMLFIYGYL